MKMAFGELTLDLAGIDEDAVFERFTPLPDFDGAPARLLDVPETIPAMAYGSHQFFRYYGKFPSIVGREIIAQHSKAGQAVMDIYSGSGTTQVEGQIAGLQTYGIDINPLAVLASNVKTAYFDTHELQDAYVSVVGRASAQGAPRFEPKSMTAEKLTKWFSSEAYEDLGKIRASLDLQPPGPAKDFLLVCFLAIVRRSSYAFDGEVRPHVNQKKRPRNPFKIFSEKFRDMVDGLIEADLMRPSGIESLTIIGDNRSQRTYENLRPKNVGLVVSHPPYLNSFNYLQVFSLEFAWAEGLDEVWRGWNREQVGKLEQRAWPATDAAILSGYYEGVLTSAERAGEALNSGGTLGVVIGDATIHKKLEPVHRIVWQGLKSSGWDPIEIWFRTTHYGIGKYAYNTRADYHGTAVKKDAIMFLRKP